MRVALDTNILATLLSQTPRTATVVELLGQCNRRGVIVVSAPVYAEALATPGLRTDLLHGVLKDTGIRVDYGLDEAVWTLAGQRFGRYALRRKKSTGETPRRILADFLIRAHALTNADQLMTFDTKVYRQDFSELRLYPMSPT